MHELHACKATQAEGDREMPMHLSGFNSGGGRDTHAWSAVDQIAHHDEEIHESRVGGSICEVEARRLGIADIRWHGSGHSSGPGERGHRDRLGGLGTQGGSMFGLVGWFG